MLRRIDKDYIVEIHEDLNVDRDSSYHLVDIIKFKEDNTYIENYLYYDGTLDTFKHMSDYHLAKLAEKLLNNPKYSKFSLQKVIDFAIKT